MNFEFLAKLFYIQVAEVVKINGLFLMHQKIKTEHLKNFKYSLAKLFNIEIYVSHNKLCF